jgi:hypothetical protein
VPELADKPRNVDGIAEEVPRQVIQVNRLLDQLPTPHPRIAPPVFIQPVIEPPPLHEQRPAGRAIFKHGLESNHRRRMPEMMPHLALHPRSVNGGDDGFRALDRQRDRLLKQQMDSSRCRRLHFASMPPRRNTEIERVQLRLLQHLREFGIARSGVAEMIRVELLCLFQMLIAQRDHRNIAHLLQRLHVRSCDFAGTKNFHSKLLHASPASMR